MSKKLPNAAGSSEYDALIAKDSGSEAPNQNYASDAHEGKPLGNHSTAAQKNLPEARSESHGEINDELSRGIRDFVSELPDICHQHYSERLPWLRAALLGSNDGLITVAGVVMGMSATTLDKRVILLSAISALFAGSFSMACGEYISISIQKDSEKAEIKREKGEFMKGELHALRELFELAEIYINRGFSEKTAIKAAQEIHSRLESGDMDTVVKIHLKEEINIDTDNLSNPMQASLSSALSFILGGLLPLLSICVSDDQTLRIIALTLFCLASFVITGILGSSLSGSRVKKSVLRIVTGGSLSLLCTYIVGSISGNVV